MLYSVYFHISLPHKHIIPHYTDTLNQQEISIEICNAFGDFGVRCILSICKHVKCVFFCPSFLFPFFLPSSPFFPSLLSFSLLSLLYALPSPFLPSFLPFTFYFLSFSFHTHLRMFIMSSLVLVYFIF